MAEDTRYEHVKARLLAMGEGTAQQVFDAIEEPNPYSQREVENVLDELAPNEPEEFEKVDGAYRWKKSYRFRMGV
ncbi:MAG TPA: hypothetical protein VOA41_21295 [Candidatus Dormibacteraeota bacterium]|nr:hypothetical protein [Candidatus Dormibacteraeota bacterium]